MEFTAKTPKDLRYIAEQIKPLIESCRITAFYGSMGAGKTTFIKSIVQALGSVSEVSSPTFALVNEYALPDDKLIFHFDFYRINNISEVYDMGYEEYFYSDDLCLIEWPEKALEILPDDVLNIYIKVLTEQERRIIIEKPKAIA